MSNAAFFTSLHAEFWRQALPDDVTDAQVDLLVELLSLPAGGLVLDTPCGHGRHAVRLAARGYRVTGLDLSDALLETARAAAAGLPAEAGTVELIRADMAAPPKGVVFDGAICLGNSLALLDQPGQFGFLETLAGALKPGGRLVIETGFLAENLYPGMDERLWLPVGDLKMLIEYRLDALTGACDCAYTIVAGDGRQETRTARMWVVTAGELLAMLDEAGFDVLWSAGDIEGTPFTLGSHDLWLLAERR
ncbi:MAG: methyltransferase domain-containing protein [Azospirillaceae bacterium]